MLASSFEIVYSGPTAIVWKFVQLLPWQRFQVNV
jgi:hypothetical protein